MQSRSCAVYFVVRQAQPDGRHAAIAVAGGAALYHMGNLLFKRAALGYWPLSHLAGLAVLTVITSLMSIETPLTMAAAVTGVLIVVAAWETRFALKAPAVDR
jgi:low temperature requirement protein LtrA